MKIRYLSSSGSSSRSGFVLFVVLVMIGVLAPVLFSLFTLSSSNYDKVEDLKNYAVAYHGAVSAVKVALYYLRHDNNNFDGIGDDWSKPYFYNYKGLGLSITIQDECGKVNVNYLSKNPYLYSLTKRLLENLNFDQSLADVLKDWVDRDSEVTGDGAETFFYESLGYRPTNGPMKSFGEILYLKGVNENLYKKLQNYFTIYSKGKINVNSAPKEVLLSLSEEMSETAVESIIENRPIKDLKELENLPGIDRSLYFKIKPFITNRCDYFKITVTASYQGAEAEVLAYTNREKVLEWKVLR